MESWTMNGRTWVGENLLAPLVSKLQEGRVLLLRGVT